MNDTHSVIVLIVGFIGAVAAIVTVALACIWGSVMSSRTDNRGEPEVLWGLYYLDPTDGRTILRAFIGRPTVSDIVWWTPLTSEQAEQMCTITRTFYEDYWVEVLPCSKAGDTANARYYK